MMKFENTNEIFSRLMLGTSQLGLNYSIINPKPDLIHAYEMLGKAFELGINTVDTARIYGNSENIIGSFLSKYPRMKIVTKFKVPPEHLRNLDLAFQSALLSLDASQKALGQKKIDMFLFHKGPEHQMEDTCRVIPEVLRRLKESGRVVHTGVSVFGPKEIVALSVFEEVEAFQVPVNIFDHRFLNRDILSRVGSSNKIVFARSIFLKGLFFKEPGDLNGNLVQARPFLKKLKGLAEEFDLNIAELAFLFVRDIPEVDSLVIGADNVRQVEKNVELLHKPALPKSLINRILSEFSSVSETIITPHFWNV